MLLPTFITPLMRDDRFVDWLANASCVPCYVFFSHQCLGVCMCVCVFIVPRRVERKVFNRYGKFDPSRSTSLSPQCVYGLHERFQGVINFSNFCVTGCTDAYGRPVLEFEDEPTRRETLSVKEVSSFLLYLARLPR